jgi:hypothetical protein
MPTIDLESPEADYRARRKELQSRLPRLDNKTLYVLNKFRKRQILLLMDEDIEDPNPYLPTYIFYCFTGNLEE